MQNQINSMNYEKGFKYLRIIVIITVILSVLFWGIKTVITPVARVSGYDTKSIDIKNEPVQEFYKYYSKEREPFEYTSLRDNKTYSLRPVAYYKLCGMVIATNNFFPERTVFDKVALYDVGIVWGNLANKDYFRKHCSASSMQMDDGSRMLHYNCSDIIQIGFTYDDLESHVSHTHLIPANKNVLGAFYKMKKYENVELEGKLVDILLGGKRTIETSIERDDDNGSSSGDGACEIMYVTTVKIGDKVYN